MYKCENINDLWLELVYCEIYVNENGIPEFDREETMVKFGNLTEEDKKEFLEYGTITISRNEWYELKNSDGGLYSDLPY
jgi:hypothetical protein